MNYTSFYTRVNWINKEVALDTPLSARNLNTMDSALSIIDNALVTLSAEQKAIDTTKADLILLNGMIVNFEIDDNTGVVTLTRYDGNTIKVNTTLNKLAVNFSYDAEQQKLYITEADGIIKEVDLSALITQYEFLESDTITFEIITDGKVMAKLRKGTINEEFFDPDVFVKFETYQNTTKSYMESAEQYANNANADATLAESHSHGGTGIRDFEDTDNSRYYSQLSDSYARGNTGIRENEDSDNSKYYSEQSKKYYEESNNNIQKQQAILDETIKKMSLAKFDVDDDGNLIYTSDTSYEFKAGDDGNLLYAVKVA